jgi:hypothetical protein
VDQYLELRGAQAAPKAAAAVAKPAGLGGAELRNAQNEFAAAERKLAKLTEQIAQLHARMAEHDQNDYTGLGALSTELDAVQTQLDTLETRWLELQELLG